MQGIRDLNWKSRFNIIYFKDKELGTWTNGFYIIYFNDKESLTYTDKFGFTL